MSMKELSEFEKCKQNAETITDLYEGILCGP